MAEVPADLLEALDIKKVCYRNSRHWVGSSRSAFYKMAPKDSMGQTRIRLEASILQKLKHPNVVRGRLLENYDWEILKVEVVQGEPLTQLRHRLSTDEKIRILVEVESAIKYINAEGVLHTDVSSENVIWDGSQSYLIDFEEAKQIIPPINMPHSPDVIGGPPCCWGDIGYGYKTYLCLDSLRAWLLTPEFLDLADCLHRVGAWTPCSLGNMCDPWTTPDEGSVYQTVTFGNQMVSGQRDPELRFRYLCTSKKIPFGNKRVLDVGCNFGMLGAFLGKLGIAQYVGLDMSPDYIELASRIAKLEGRNNSFFVAGDICSEETEINLSALSPNGYHIVVCQSVYHHVLDKQIFWKMVSSLGCHWIIFEGPVNASRYLLTKSWVEEKALIGAMGYKVSFESLDNDYPGRILAVFEKVAC